MSLFTGATLLGMGLAGGLGSAAIQAHQTGKAVDAQTNAANQALALQQQVYNDQKQNAAPYQQLGTSTLGRLGQMAAQPANQFNPANYQGGVPVRPQGLPQMPQLPPQQAMGSGLGTMAPGQTQAGNAGTAGGGDNTVTIQTPDGRILRGFPRERVAEAQARGAKVV